jgi:hypothetical protein
MEDNINLSWEEAVILRIESSCNSSLGLIDDPDNILSEQVLTSLLERGWRITSVSNTLELRYEYEDQIRNVPLPTTEHAFYIIRFPVTSIPYDIQREAEIIQLCLKHFFPQLSYNVIRSLPLSWHPVVYKNQSKSLNKQQRLGEVETATFIITDCLGLDYAPNPTFIDILSLLADVALHKLEIPPSLRSFIPYQQRDSRILKLYEYMSSPEKAVHFLRTVWQEYIQYKANNSIRVSDKSTNEITESVTYLDKNREFQTKITALIAENLIHPADLSDNFTLPAWLHLGVHYHLDKSVRLRDTLEHLTDIMPGENNSFEDWVDFSFQYSNWCHDFYQTEEASQDIYITLEELTTKLDHHYFSWLEKHYPSLIMQPHLPYPTCGHQVLNHISSTFKPSSSQPVALVVIDGMSMLDWLVIRSEWLLADMTWNIEEKGLLALVPTLTSVSRQAMLSGKLPRYFEKSWLNTNYEEKYWGSFWEEHGLHPKTTSYARGLGMQNYSGESDLVLEKSIEEVLYTPHLSVAVFIVSTIDNLIHTSILGNKDFYNRVHHWVFNNRYIRILVSRLLEQVNAVIITSDHGHVAGKGIGDLSLSSVAEERALRARVFKGDVFQRLTHSHSEITLWQNTGLPKDTTVILPKGRGMFDKVGNSRISHGGATLEENIVPYIIITK